MREDLRYSEYAMSRECRLQGWVPVSQRLLQERSRRVCEGEPVLMTKIVCLRNKMRWFRRIILWNLPSLGLALYFCLCLVCVSVCVLVSADKDPYLEITCDNLSHGMRNDFLPGYLWANIRRLPEFGRHRKMRETSS